MSSHDGFYAVHLNDQGKLFLSACHDHWPNLWNFTSMAELEMKPYLQFVLKEMLSQNIFSSPETVSIDFGGITAEWRKHFICERDPELSQIPT
jgi:hypothetical protein